MILIHTNADNTFDLTLAEKTTLASPFYLFVFQNDLTKKYVKFTAEDISDYKSRYNRFVILNGVVTLNPTGYWSYKVYEQTTNSNLNEKLSTGLVEQGKVLVIGEATTTAAHSTTRTYKGYGKGSSI